MSTRCHIRVKEANSKLYPCMIYKHSDGYPERTLPFLEKFTKRFFKERGDDAEYYLAQLLRHWAIEDQKESENNEWYKENEKYLPKNQFYGWGVCLTSDPHGDIEYLYTVDLATGKVTVESAR